MRTLTYSILRSLTAMLVGFLLVSNPTEMTELLVQIMGGLFALSGLIALVGYGISRYRANENSPAPSALYAVVGVGCLAFGILLLLMPVTFIDMLMYGLGVLLVLIGISQISTLIAYRKVAPLTWSLFILPVAIIAAGCFVVLHPLETASLPFTILGIAYICYGVTEFMNGWRFYRYIRKAQRLAEELPTEPVLKIEAEGEEEITEEE